MSKEIKIAGSISFGGKRLNVYGDLDAPLFKAKDISHAIGYSSGNEWRMLEMCEDDEKLKLPLVVAGQRRSINFVTENGLYNILAQSRMEIARSWRRVVHDELINMRKKRAETSLSSSKSGITQWITFTLMRKPVSLCSRSRFLVEM